MLRGQESNLRHSAYETGGEPSSPQYGVIDRNRTDDLLNHNQTLLPTELQPQSQVQDSNLCEWFCRPPPRLSDNLTYLRPLKDSNLYQNIRSVSCYPLHQETKLFPLGFSIMFPTSIFSMFIRIYWFSVSVSSPYFIG